jgi:hypothetical protein
MSKFLAMPSTIFRNWRTWLKGQIIADVPPEDAFCEFECRKSECRLGHWAQCKNRLSHLDLDKTILVARYPTRAE